MTALRPSCGLVVIALMSCSGDNSSTRDSATALTPVVPVVTGAAGTQTTASGCVHTGLWAACSIERRLKQSGFVVKKLDEVAERPGFSVKPLVYSLGSSRLEVFIYDDENALARDLRGIDTVRVAPPGSAAVWPSTPTFIRSANLAAVFLLARSPRQAERVVLAITAGPPQPGSPR